MKKHPIYEIKELLNEAIKQAPRPALMKAGPQNLVQVRILEYLINHEGQKVSQKDFEEVLNIRKSTISGVLDTMERNQIIRRVAATTDARKKYIEPTETARQKQAEMRLLITRIDEILTRDIPPEKLAVFFEVLDSMRDNLKQVNESN